MPLWPRIVAPVGKSGPLIRCSSASSSSSRLAVGVLQVPLDAVGHLAQVVRRDVGGHADGDARGAVDQQVREPRRQDGRFLVLAVVVVLEVDGVLVDVPDHFHGQRRHLGLGVPRGGGAVVAGRAEVALAQGQRVPHGPVLDQADQGIVDRRVAVRVVLAHDLAHHAGALVEGAVRAVAAVEHRVEHAAVHRLEAVAHVRQRTAHDDRHGVVQVGPLHFGLQVHLLHRGRSATSPSSGSSPNAGSPAGSRRRLRRSSFQFLCQSLVAVEPMGQPGRPMRGPARCPGSGRPWRSAG